MPTCSLCFLPKVEVSFGNASSPLSLRICWDFLRISRAAAHDFLCCTREEDFLNSFPQVGAQVYTWGIQINVKRRINRQQGRLGAIHGGVLMIANALAQAISKTWKSWYVVVALTTVISKSARQMYITIYKYKIHLNFEIQVYTYIRIHANSKTYATTINVKFIIPVTLCKRVHELLRI